MEKVPDIKALSNEADSNEVFEEETKIDELDISPNPDDLKSIVIKISDKVVLDKEDDMGYFDLEMDVEMLIGLTLLKLGFASSFDEMDILTPKYSFHVDGHDLRTLESDKMKVMCKEGAIFNLV